jgi:hypothetical protein
MSRLHLIRRSAFLLATSLLACSDSTAPSASTLNGTWSRLGEVPGSSERWTLTVTGSSIAGTGTWSGEACCGGTLTVTGTIDGDAIHVDVTLVAVASFGSVRPDVHEHFDGTLAGADTLVGTGTVDNQSPFAERFARQ